ETPARLADQRQRGDLQHQCQLEVVSRLGLVIDQSRQLPARPLAGVPQVDIEGTGTRTIERRYLVVAPGRAGLDVGGHPSDLDRRLWQDPEVLRQGGVAGPFSAVAGIK